MKKKATAPKSKTEWVLDPPVPFDGDENEELKKPKIGEVVEGTYVDVKESTSYPGKKIHKIRDLNSPITWVLTGTTVLDRMMRPHKIGDIVRIERLADRPSKFGKPTQMFTISTLKTEKSEEAENAKTASEQKPDD